jgi:hypothetical protein
VLTLSTVQTTAPTWGRLRSRKRVATLQAKSAPSEEATIPSSNPTPWLTSILLAAVLKKITGGSNT